MRHDSVALGDGAQAISFGGEACSGPQHGPDHRPEGSEVGLVGGVGVEKALQVLDMP
jgi:hypothetical protein